MSHHDDSGSAGTAGGAGLPDQSDRPDVPLVCSAKGCRASAIWALRWNNPKLHDAQRRKTWLACGQHRERLGEFLAVRGFLREVAPLD
ncbi:hypothetical protein O7632_15975 [Solwaraspora sp. WMMD406]|uniref:hypothetical protein n=1 Tax=Solwaraspora sp. WMMD406 TaxID=3016095 RepID=UPI002417ABB9|nr:hypothetical protein [Solwaraspora sp. WMMD406]MDG4765583.1 hypothetical protein [Solwaraspora sp. WMMD406]